MQLHKGYYNLIDNKRERIQFEGEVMDANKGQFKIKVNDNYSILCTLSGKIRQNSVKILVGDKVTCEVSEYDPSRGRIVFRHKS